MLLIIRCMYDTIIMIVYKYTYSNYNGQSYAIIKSLI